MAYYAENETQAEAGLMFYRPEPYNPETHRIAYINGEFVCVPRTKEKT